MTVLIGGQADVTALWQAALENEQWTLLRPQPNVPPESTRIYPLLSFAFPLRLCVFAVKGFRYDQ